LNYKYTDGNDKLFKKLKVLYICEIWHCRNKVTITVKIKDSIHLVENIQYTKNIMMIQK